MKKVYLVQYNTNDSSLFEHRLKNFGDWVKYFSDNWLIASDQSAKEIYQTITEGNEDKSILIIEVDTKNYYGRMNTKVWDFLKKHKIKQ